MKDKIRFGIIGTGKMAHMMYEACMYFFSHIEINIFDFDKESILSFVDEYGIDKHRAFFDIDKFIENIDVVYISTSHETHYEYARMLLEANKHVLCEKPLVLNKDKAVELFEMAKKRGKILMEAVKTAYCPGFKGIMSLIKEGRIGDIVDVEVCMTQINNSDSKAMWDEKNGGSFIEFGTYTLLPIVKLLGKDSRETFIWSLPTVTGVDSYSKMVIVYDKMCATVKTGIGVKSEGQLIIAGSNGYILVPSPWWLTKRVEVHYEDSKKVEVYDYKWEINGLQYELDEFLNRILLIEETYKNECNILQKNAIVLEHLKKEAGITPDESIWFASYMQLFEQRMRPILITEKKITINSMPKIWAHRGCCMKYPENTLEAFEAAANLQGIVGIELDIQLTSDGEIVVIHDERINRTTNGAGKVNEYSLNELKQFCITDSGCDDIYITDWRGSGTLSIPTMKEVIELLKPYCIKNGLLINIELKNDEIRYEGMEEKILDLVQENGIKDYVIYSSFNHESMGVIKKLDSTAKTGTLATNIQDCLKGAKKNNADALHPCITGLLVNNLISENKDYEGFDIRAWAGDEPFYGQHKMCIERDLNRYTALGVTDIITNVPEMYLS